MLAVLANQKFCDALIAGVGGVDAMPCLWVIRYFRVGAMTAQFVGVIRPPAVAVLWIEARVVVRASAYFTKSSCHNR